MTESNAMKPQEIQAGILRALDQSEDGLSIEALQEALPDIARRTLQRHLAHLVQNEKLIPVDRARARRYRLAVLKEKAAAQPGGVEPAIPLSPQGSDVRALVRRPIEQRAPVGYVREFLNGYVPNRTAYLPKSLREKLHRMGSASWKCREGGTSMAAVPFS